MKNNWLVLTLAVVMASCTDTVEVTDSQGTGNIINVAGIGTDDMIATAEVSTRSGKDGRALSNVDPTGAENEHWLIQPLKKGFDITYGLYKDHTKSNEHVAILKLIGNNPDDDQYNTSQYGYAEYSFNYRDDNNGSETTNPAQWYDNGAHYFEGLHVPNRIRYTTSPDELATDQRTINGTIVAAVKDITTDQHDGTDTGTDDQLGNYTLLSHYLGMPASTHISATVSRIKLPFQHRLARVLVYVLIDPSLGATTKINGYNYSEDAEGNITPDNPVTSDIRFNNVEVLAGVKDVYDATKKVHTLTPTWAKPRKVIPHFVREDGTRDNKGILIDGYESNFVMYTNIEKNTHVFGTQEAWASINNSYNQRYKNKQGTEAEKTAYAEEATGYRRTQYGKVPLYDLIVRPTYTTLDNVMYDEDLTNITKEQLVTKRNSIDFYVKLNSGLEYEKTFNFDLDANYQTAVYLVIDREEVNYNASGAEKWIETDDNDEWYGLDNKNGNTLSLAGNSWQRAYTHSASPTEIDGDGADKVTDGGFYNENTTGEDGTTGQYLSLATWKKFFAQAYEGGEHHGDYFILTSDITIDASELPAGFVFTGHLDARGNTITYTGGGDDIYEETTQYGIYPATPLFTYDGSSYSQYTLPDLYVSEETAQAKGGPIPAGEGMMRKVTVTLAEVMANNVEYYVRNNDDTYSLFERPTRLYTHRKGASSLFGGINGTYTTNQESAEPRVDADGNVIFEANVHLETNNSRTNWVPTMGWRAEVLNTRVLGGTMFPTGTYPCTGNVRNCYDKNGAVSVPYTPALPQYK